VLQQMAVNDKSLYLDTTNENGPKLMNSGKIAMLVTGPWDLSQLSDIQYGVQVLPTFAGSTGGHQTIAGPDNWVVFDNGDKKKQAAIDFVKWLSAPEEVKTFSLGTGDLPIRTSVGQDQAVLTKLNENVPGTGTFVQNLSNVKKVRPTVVKYPDVSEALGQAIVSVMLGKDQPADALKSAAQAADTALADK
jgi:multiple sugar transport system substrate-binding protein